MFRITLLNHLILCTSDPDQIEELTRRKDFIDKSFMFYDMLQTITKKGLVQLRGAEWNVHRKWLAPGFKKGILDSFVPIFCDEAKGFVDRVVPDREEDVSLNVTVTIARNFLRTTYREDCSEQVGNVKELLDFVALFMYSVHRRTFNPLLWSNRVFAWTSMGRKVLSLSKKMRVLAKTLVEKKRDELTTMKDASCEKTHKPLMDIMLGPTAIGKLMPEEDILDEFLTFLVANVDTTQSALQWMLKVLSLQPEVQEKLYAEVMTVIGERDVTCNDLQK